MARYALYLGCTVPVRGMNYEMAARKVAERLSVTISSGIDCGRPISRSRSP